MGWWRIDRPFQSVCVPGVFGGAFTGQHAVKKVDNKNQLTDRHGECTKGDQPIQRQQIKELAREIRIGHPPGEAPPPQYVHGKESTVQEDES